MTQERMTVKQELRAQVTALREELANVTQERDALRAELVALRVEKARTLDNVNSDSAVRST